MNYQPVLDGRVFYVASKDILTLSVYVYRNCTGGFATDGGLRQSLP